MPKGHKEDICQCYICKSKRGEYRGENHPFYGKHHTEGAKKKIGNAKTRYIHGESGNLKTRIYRIWQQMKTRCYNPNYPNYYRYGAKGIKVCDEWLDKEKGYINFRDWALSHSYNDNLEIHRKKHHLGYSPENCEWIDPSKHGKWHRNFYLLKKRSEKFFKKIVGQRVN